MVIRIPPDSGEVTDSAVIDASLTDRERFAEIFHRHWQELFRYIAFRLGPEVAEDVGAETFTAAFRGRARYDLTRTDARPWLYGIATNLIRQHRRTERRRHEVLARTRAEWAAASFDDASDERVTAEQYSARISAVLAKLSATERDLLLLVAWADLSYEQVSQTLGLPLGTVRSRLHRVRKKVRRALGDIDPMNLEEESS